MTRLARYGWLLLVVCGCGSDYAPPDLPTTGQPAGPLGQVYDLDVSLPGLTLAGNRFSGASLEMRIVLEHGGYGDIPAVVEYGSVHLGLDTAAVADLTDGRTVVTVTPDRWITGRLGPLQIETAVFEMLLDGGPLDGGFRVEGTALESQTALPGTFVGWRRHRFLVAGTDFFSSSGRVSELELRRGGALHLRQRLELVSSDPVLRITGSAVFAVNRFTFDNLQRLDPQRDFSTVWQSGVGAGSNPQDVLLLTEDKGYLSRYEPPFDDVAVFDPHDGRLTASIDLSPLARNPDGTPRATRLQAVDGLVFVALQEIDRSFTVYEEGRLGVIDPSTDTVLGSIPLGGKNPFAVELLAHADGTQRLYVALAGIFPGLQGQELSGGVVVVDPASLTLERLALDDDTAGGNVAGLALAGERLGYVVVSDTQFVNRVLAFDPAQGTILRTVFESGNLIPEIALSSGGVLAVPDRSFAAPRLCLFGTHADPLLPETGLGCVALELPPFSVEAAD